jgi:hypothetical protein
LIITKLSQTDEIKYNPRLERALVFFLASNSARKGIFDLELGHNPLLKHEVTLIWWLINKFLK